MLTVPRSTPVTGFCVAESTIQKSTYEFPPNGFTSLVNFTW